MYRAAYPDLLITVDDLIAEGNKVVGRWTARGTNTGPLMGMPPTGKQATVMGISILAIADGKVTDQWFNWDTLGMLQQLGVIPTPGQG
jgi:predicted ester cyclase